MNGFRLRRLTLSQGLALAIIVLSFPLFFWGGPSCGDCPFYQAVWNLGHPLFFGFTALALLPWSRLRGWRLWLAATALTFAAGGIIELLQGLVGRDMDIRDVYRDLTGAWIVLAWYPGKIPARSLGEISARLAARSLFTLLICLELLRVGSVGLQQWHMDHQLPALYDFTKADPQAFWSGPISLSSRFEQTGYYPLHVNLAPSQHYPGVFLDNLPNDWTGYHSLVVTLYNPETGDLHLTLRINDAQHENDGGAFSDRFNRSLVLKPGRNRYLIPLEAIQNAPKGRLMNMDHIDKVGLFATAPKRPVSFLILGLRLH